MIRTIDKWEGVMKVTMRSIISILLTLLSVVTLGFEPSSAQVKRDSNPQFKISKKGLEVSDYKKVVLLIELEEYYDEDVGGGKIGLTKEMLRAECESRLKQAGLEIMSGFNRPEYLYVNVNIRYRSFYILMQLNRPVLYRVKETEYMKYGAKTWQGILLGQHGYTPEYIMECLDKLLEDFINEYLKANTE